MIGRNATGIGRCQIEQVRHEALLRQRPERVPILTHHDFSRLHLAGKAVIMFSSLRDAAF